MLDYMNGVTKPIAEKSFYIKEYLEGAFPFAYFIEDTVNRKWCAFGIKNNSSYATEIMTYNRCVFTSLEEAIEHMDKMNIKQDP
jgi:hypothetical protein